MTVQKEINIKYELEITQADVERWLIDCQDPSVLRSLARQANAYARGLEHPDDDDFRSRA